MNGPGIPGAAHESHEAGTRGRSLSPGNAEAASFAPRSDLRTVRRPPPGADFREERNSRWGPAPAMEGRRETEVGGSRQPGMAPMRVNLIAGRIPRPGERFNVEPRILRGASDLETRRVVDGDMRVERLRMAHGTPVPSTRRRPSGREFALMIK